MRPIPLALATLLLGATAPAAGADWGDARKAFRDAQRSEDWNARKTAYLAILDHDGADAVAEVTAALWRETNAAVQVAAMQTLGRFVTPAARTALDEATRDAKGVRKHMLLCVLADAKTDVGRGAILDALGTGDGPALALSAVAAGKRGIAEAVPRLLELLAHKDWQVRAAAARGLLPLAGGIPADARPKVLDAMEAAKGRERADLAALLAKLHGKDLGIDVAAWRRLAGGESVVEPAVLLPTWVATLPVHGRRVVLVLDHSNTTDNPHPFTDRTRLQALCKVPGARDVPWFNLRTNAQFIAAHAKRLVSDLPAGTSLGLVTVGGKKVDVGLVALKPANPGAKAAVVREIDDMKPETGMDLLAAMQAALDAGGREPAAWTNGPDEIVLLACGTPWLAEVTEPAVVGAAVGLRARLRCVPIIAVGVGAHPQEMMRVMADLSGGRYLSLHE
jgi:hypothetical protein